LSKFHKRNIHKDRYDLIELAKVLPELSDFIVKNPDGENTVDFTDSKAVLFLNKALLKKYYNVDNWMIPEGYLCPPIPGRADYIHYAADLLSDINQGEVPRGKRVNVLDIGTGANCVYPIIGSQSYGWKFTATEIDPLSLKVARLIVQSNPSLSKQVKIKQQKQKQFILHRMIDEKDRFDLTVCNPPFHGSKKEALESNIKKWNKLSKSGEEKPVNLNFGGMENELWYPGGETAFIKRMIKESCDYKEQVCWFTSLVSRKENLKPLENQLKISNVKDNKIISMSHGQKQSRLIAWTFLSEEERNDWAVKYFH
jgi:23S rRNA (adenine1618-N6)-methyltransferase